jgi:hypothetical protein
MNRGVCAQHTPLPTQGGRKLLILVIQGYSPLSNYSVDQNQHLSYVDL